MTPILPNPLPPDSLLADSPPPFNGRIRRSVADAVPLAAGVTR